MTIKIEDLREAVEANTTTDNKGRDFISWVGAYQYLCEEFPSASFKEIEQSIHKFRNFLSETRT